jgi:hypothetical protein
VFGTSVKYSNKDVDQAANEVKPMSADMEKQRYNLPFKTSLTASSLRAIPKDIFIE